MTRRAILRHLGLHDVVADESGRSGTLVRNTRNGLTTVLPRGAVIDDLIVETVCKLLDVPLPPSLSDRPRSARAGSRAPSRNSRG